MEYFYFLSILGIWFTIGAQACMKGAFSQEKIISIAPFNNSLLIVATEKMLSIYQNISAKPISAIEMNFVPKKIKSSDFSITILSNQNDLHVFSFDLIKSSIEYKGQFASREIKIKDFIRDPHEEKTIISFDENRVVFLTLNNMRVDEYLFKQNINNNLFLKDENLLISSPDTILEINMNSTLGYIGSIAFDPNVPFRSTFDDGILLLVQGKEVIHMQAGKERKVYKINNLTDDNFPKDVILLKRHNALLLHYQSSLAYISLHDDKYDGSEIINTKLVNLFENNDIIGAKGIAGAEQILVFGESLYIMNNYSIHQYDLSIWPPDVHSLCSSRCEDPNCHNCPNDEPSLCVACGDGFTSFKGRCLQQSKCPVGCSSCSDPFSCSLCYSGYYLTSKFQCQDCSLAVSYCEECVGSNNFPNLMKCLKCEVGFALDSAGLCISQQTMNCPDLNCYYCYRNDVNRCIRCKSGNFYLNGGVCETSDGSNPSFVVEKEPANIVKIVAAIGIALSGLGLLWAVIASIIIFKGIITILKSRRARLPPGNITKNKGDVQTQELQPQNAVKMLHVKIPVTSESQPPVNSAAKL